MNYGLYLAASGVLTHEYRQDVFANNLANVNTTAFKPHVPALTQRAPETVEDDLGGDVSQRLLERLGGGVFAGPQRIDFSEGRLEKTGNPLDVALTGDNAFFAVRYTDPATGQPSTRLTRDGRFSINNAGQLVTPDGQPVLDPQDQPITIDPTAPATIDRAGRVIQNGQPAAQVQVASVRDLDALRKTGDNLFAFTAGDDRQRIDAPRVEPGFIEGSGVDPMKGLMNVIDATRAVTGNAKMIQYFDTMMGDAINTLGRVA